MLLITLFGVLTLIGIIMVIIAKKSWNYDNLSSPGWMFITIFGLGFIACLICTIDLKSDFAYQEDQYNNLKAQVEMCDRDDILTDANLRNQVLGMNNGISRHKQYSKNVWIGMYYSERLGSLEPLQWKSKR